MNHNDNPSSPNLNPTDSPHSSGKPDFEFRTPRSEDGYIVHQLIASCPPLDSNSIYCNLLQCTHFADTCVVVEREGEIIGFLSGYLKPGQPDVLFVWQMAVAASARGCGLAGRMLDAVLLRSQLAGVRFIETSITEENEASQGVFRKLAKKRNAEIKVSILFDKEAHFHGRHDSEQLFRIGPFG